MVHSRRARLTHRFMDLALSASALPFCAPLLVAGAAAVKLTSAGPVLFRHRRIGRDGASFAVMKLRTMTHRPQGGGPAITSGGDARITAAGRWLRKSKLDELPQFLNVLRGEMSIVGPRPEAPAYVDLDDSRWRAVLAVRPGITDLSSLTFRNEEAVLEAAHDKERAYREVVLPRKLALALEGVEKKSVPYDALIMIKTALSIIGVSDARASAEVEAALDEVAALNARISASHTPASDVVPERETA